MSSIREKLSSVVFLWIGFGLVLVTMVFIAFPAIEVEFEGVVNSAAIFWRRVPVWVGNWPMFVGYMSILVGGILMGSMALSFVQPSALTEKIILLVAGGLLLLGVILVFCFKETFFAVNGWGESVRDVSWGPYVAASIATLALACDGVALALDW